MINDIIDLNHLQQYEFIRYELNDNNICFFLVSDEHDHHDEEDKDDCCHLNGHLYKLTFLNISDLVITGEDADSYIYTTFEIKDKHLTLSLKGINYASKNTELHISFRFLSHQIEDLGTIKEADA